jgi:hypothetical protein
MWFLSTAGASVPMRSARHPCIPQMPFGEGDTRTGFQIPFEGEGSRFIGERDHDIDRPGRTVRRMRALRGVVLREARRHVCGDARVIACRMAPTSQDVDESFRTGHASGCAIRMPGGIASENRGTSRRKFENSNLSCGPPSRRRRYGGQPSREGWLANRSSLA